MKQFAGQHVEATLLERSTKRKFVGVSPEDLNPFVQVHSVLFPAPKPCYRRPMVFIGDRFFPLNEHEPRIDVTSDVINAFERLHNPAHARPFRSHTSSEEGYGEYRLTMHAASKNDFQHLFDFYVNLPGTDRSRIQPQYIWRPLTPHVTLEKHFEFLYHPAQALRTIVDVNETIQIGFVVFEDYGRIDEVTTWSHVQRALATDRSVLFVDCYSVTLH